MDYHFGLEFSRSILACSLSNQCCLPCRAIITPNNQYYLPMSLKFGDEDWLYDIVLNAKACRVPLE